MLISTKGRYALRVMADIARHSNGGFIPLMDVARRQEISEKYLEGILSGMTKCGLLIGLRGKGGGYKPAVPPENCTVGSVLRAVEPSLAPVACLSGSEKACSRADTCETLPVWKGLNSAINEYLDSITIADIIMKK